MNREGSGGDDLVTTMARLLPTPTARDHKGANPNEREGGLDPPGALTTSDPTAPPSLNGSTSLDDQPQLPLMAPDSPPTSSNG
jgi:hypothetical protein